MGMAGPGALLVGLGVGPGAVALGSDLVRLSRIIAALRGRCKATTIRSSWRELNFGLSLTSKFAMRFSTKEDGTEN